MTAPNNGLLTAVKRPRKPGPSVQSASQTWNSGSVLVQCHLVRRRKSASCRVNPQLRLAAPIPPTPLFRRPLVVRDQGAIFFVDHALAAGVDGVHVVHLHYLVPDQFGVATLAAFIVALQRPQKIIDCLQAGALGWRAGNDLNDIRPPRAEIALEARFRPFDGGAKGVRRDLLPRLEKTMLSWSAKG